MLCWETPGKTRCSQGVYRRHWPGQERQSPPCKESSGDTPHSPVTPAHGLGYLSISVHHKMSSFSFMKTGKCWSLPCFMEFDLVVMVLTLLNWKTREGGRDERSLTGHACTTCTRHSPGTGESNPAEARSIQSRASADPAALLFFPSLRPPSHPSPTPAGQGLGV